MKNIAIDKISPAPELMREFINEQELQQLYESILRLGIIQSVVVRKNDDGYELIAGYRRFLCATRAQFKNMPCEIIEATQAKAEEIKMAENRCREKVNPIDEGNYFQSIMVKYSWDVSQLAHMNGVSKSYIQQRLTSVNWDTQIKQAIAQGELAFSVARELSAIENDESRYRITRQAIDNGSNTATATEWRKNANLFDVSNTEGIPEHVPQGLPSVPAEITLDCQICLKPSPVAEIHHVRMCNGCLQVVQSGG